MWGLLGYGTTFAAIAAAAGVASLFTDSGAPPAGNGTVDAFVPLVRWWPCCALVVARRAA